MFDCCRNYDTPATLRLSNGPREITIKQQIVQGGIALIRLHDAVEKSRANDAAASPNCRDVAEIKVPVVDFACGSKQLHPLRVRNNFRRVKRVAHHLDESGAVASEFANSRLRQNFRRSYAVFFACGDDARFNRRINCRNYD